MKTKRIEWRKKLFFSENIFKSAVFRLTMVYFLIIASICAIFNIVICNSIKLEKIEFVKPEKITLSDDFRQKIIDNNNRQTEKQLFEAMLILNASILLAGGWGSLILARKTLEPIERAHRLQSEFVSNASHEIRTPLSAIQLEAELILSDPKASKQDLREVIESNLEEAKSLSALTEMLLKLSKIDREIPLENVNVNEIVRARIGKFNAQISDKKAQIQLEETKDFIALAEPTIVDELATILLDNALKYSKNSQPVAVKIFRANRQIVLEITNASQQFSDEEMSKFFNRFYRADTARSCNGKCEGHGLGLAIAKKLTSALGGQISVRNEKQGEGHQTIFKICLRFGK